jgi:hypothetical protein
LPLISLSIPSLVFLSLDFSSLILKRQNTFAPLLLALPFLYFVLGIVRVNSNWSEALKNMDTCPLCVQIQIQNFWKASKIDTPLFSLSEGYVPDKELFLTRTHRIEKTDESFNDNRRFPERYYSVGEFKKPWAKEFLDHHHCQPVFVVASNPPQKGLWKCSE